jgi:hypothetical protein
MITDMTPAASRHSTPLAQVRYGQTMAFDEFDGEALSSAHDRIAAAALDAARLIAAERLSSALGAGTTDPTTITAVLMARDPSDDRYDVLKAFEQRWALAVVRLLEPITNPAPAIRDARSRGVTVAAIAQVLGIAHQTVYARYGHQIVIGRADH